MSDDTFRRLLYDGNARIELDAGPLRKLAESAAHASQLREENLRLREELKAARAQNGESWPTYEPRVDMEIVDTFDPPRK